MVQVGQLFTTSGRAFLPLCATPGMPACDQSTPRFEDRIPFHGGAAEEVPLNVSTLNAGMVALKDDPEAVMVDCATRLLELFVR